MKAKSLLDPGSMLRSALFLDLVERLRKQLPEDHPLLLHLREIAPRDDGRRSASDRE